MEAAALTLSVIALLLSLVVSHRQIQLSRHANSLPVLVDLFREHRSIRLAEARKFAYSELPGYDVSDGLASLPQEKQELLRELAWYYDNLGALVAHGVIDLPPVSGYLGGSLILTWERMQPLVEAERARRPDTDPDPTRWQAYFENLYYLVREAPPAQARTAEVKWRIPNPTAEPH